MIDRLPFECLNIITEYLENLENIIEQCRIFYENNLNFYFLHKSINQQSLINYNFYPVVGMNESNLFKGPVNNAKVGIPVPLCYGRTQVGGAVINFGFTETRLTNSPGFTFGSKPDNAYGGGNYSGGTGGGNAGGGDGGGGSTPIIHIF